jgi:hypothetical protein
VAHVTPAATNRATTHPGVSFSLTTDKTKGGSPCNTCHQDYPPNDTTSLNSWAGILREHSATDTCDICHDFFTHGNTTGATDTPPLQTVRDAIKSNTVTCATCHTAKAGPTATDHGGHLPTDWSGNAACNDCHATSQVEFDAVVDKIHNGDCTLCHFDPAGSNYTRIAGTDGTALLMVGRVGDCLDCHNPATYSEPFIHHDTVNADTTTLNNGCTTDCHNNTTGHQGVHTATVVNAAPCSACHTTTANTGGDGNVLVDSGAGAMVHDYCTSCHRREVAGDVRLMLDTVSTLVTAMPEGTTPIAGGTDGGGVCTNCHGDYFGTNTTGHTHSHVMTRTASCATANCHDANGGANARKTSAAPFVGSGDVHETISCVGCHNVATNGGPVGSAVNWNGGAWGGAGSCTNCHNSGIFGTIHAGISAGNLTTYHAAKVTTAGTSCTLCHDGVGSSAAPVATTSPYVGGSEVHSPSSCATCHAVDGTMRSAPTKAPLLSSTGGNCEACHGAYFNTHTHHTTGNNDFTITGADLSYAAPGQSCGNSSGSSCHHDYDDDGATSPKYPELSNWITIQWEHDRTDGTKDGVGACITCHNGDLPIRAGNIDPAFINPNDNVRGVVKTGVGVHCLDCHSDKVAPGVHGLDYIDHLLVNGTGQSTLGWPPVIANAECVTCHVVVANYGDDLGLIPADSPGDVVIDIHSKNCGACHRSQPELKLTPYDFSVFEQTDSVGGLPNPDGVLCVECHQSGITITVAFHQMLPGDTQVINRHDNFNLTAGCLECHKEIIDMTSALTRHGSCEVCHTAGGTAAAAIAAGEDKGGVTAQDCTSCHTSKGGFQVDGSYSLHGLTGDTGGDGVATEHNNLGASGGSNCSASGCHSMGTATAKLALHVQGCRTCHAPDVLTITDPDPQGGDAAAVIVAGLPVGTDNGPTGSNLSQTCDQCHVNLNSFKKHGLLDADAALVHENLKGSLVSGAADPLNCENCHNSSNAETRIGLHQNCNTCHDPAKPVAATQIGLGMGATFIECEDCHDAATGSYTMHKMTVSDVGTALIHNNIGFDAACVGCHDLTNQTTMLALHTAPKQGHNGTCLTCHNPAKEVPALAATPASTVIFNGQTAGGVAGGNGAAQNCVSCHDGSYLTHGLADGDAAHPTLVDPITSTSTCSTGAGSCHTILTVPNKLATHTVGCLVCHNSTDPQVMTAISDGYAASPNSAPCEDCHGGTPQAPLKNISGQWYNHNDPDHTPTTLNRVLIPDAGDPNAALATVDCDGCHTGDVISAVHNFVAPAPTFNVCEECHTADSTLKGSATGKNAGGQCIFCHGNNSPYFDNHATRSTGHGTAMNMASAASGGDRAQSGEQLCSDCHYDSLGSHGGLGSGLALDTWAEIIVEHQSVAGVGTGLNACEVCHLSTRSGATTINPAAGTSVAEVIAAGATRKCLDCHWDKRSPNGHGGHDATHFQWDGTSQVTCGAADCHAWVANDNPAVVGGVHPLCTNCHLTSSGGDGTLISAPARAPGLASASLAAPHADTCTVCHSGVGGGFGAHTHDHSGTVEANTSSASATVTCNGCHATGVTSPYIQSGTPGTHINCASCHDGADNTRAASKAADANEYGSASVPAECNECHTGYFDGHAHHDVANQVAFDVLVDLSQEANQTACNACHPDTSSPNAYGTLLAPTWAGILAEHNTQGDGGTGCNTCHDATTLSDKSGSGGTPNDTLVGTVIGTDATAKCTTCHTLKLWTNAASTHGGHAAGSFGWTAGTIASCGTGAGTSCHSGDVVAVVHLGSFAIANSNNPCVNCHNDPVLAPGGGDGNTGVGSRGVGTAEVPPANATTHTEACTVCHTLSIGATHHSGPNATSGNCIACHMPKVGTQGNPIATRSTIMMPKELACNFCHLWWPNNQTYVATATDTSGYDTTTVSGKVMVYKLVFDPTTNLRAMATASPVTSHAISTNSTTPINDYGACFACHGATGNGSNGTTGIANYALGDAAGVADMIVPFHGLGNPLTATEAGTLAVVNQADVLKHVVNFYAGPLQVTENTGLAAKDEPWNPGYIAFNWMAPEVSMNPSGGTRPYANSTKAYKSIHKSEYNNIYQATVDTKRVAALTFTTSKASIQWNNWGADLGTVGSRTFNVGVLGSKAKTTDIPLVPLNIPVNVVAP